MILKSGNQFFGKDHAQGLNPIALALAAPGATIPT